MTVEIEQGVTDGIAFRAAGPRGAPVLLFLHGVGGAARVFDGQLAEFSDRFRAVAWDAPGYGASTRAPATTIAATAAQLAAFIAAHELHQPVLVGHSLGGMIVQEYLAAKLGPAKGAVLLATSAAFGKPDGDWQKAFIAARLGPLDAGRSMRDIAAGLVADMAGSHADAAGLALAVDCMASVAPEAYRVSVQSLVGFDRRAALGEILVPTLLVAGEVDRTAPADVMARMAARIANATFVVIPGAGHLPNLEMPAAFNTALRQFLDRLSSGKTTA